MLKNFALTAYAILVVTEQCFGIHFLELPGFDSDFSHEHRGLKKSLKTDDDTGDAHRPQHKKSSDYKHFRRMQAKVPKTLKKLDHYHDADGSLKILGYHNIPQEPQEMVTDNEYEMLNSKVRAVNENMELRNIDTAIVVQTGRQHRNLPLKQKVIPLHGVEGKLWRSTQVPVRGENIQSQSNHAAVVQTNHQNRYPPLKQEIRHAPGNERKQWHNSEIPIAKDKMEHQNVGKAIPVNTEHQNRYPLLKQEVTPFHKIDKRPWGNTRVLVGRRNMEATRIDEEVVQTQRHSRYPPIHQNVEDLETHNVDTAVQKERQDRYLPLKKEAKENKESYNYDAGVPTEHHIRYLTSKQKPRENIEPQDIETVEIVQLQHRSEYPLLKQKDGEDFEHQNINRAVKNEHEDRYPPLKEKHRENMEPNNYNEDMQAERQNIYPPLKPREPTDSYIERRHWLVARKDGESSNIPPINKDDKDATLKAKINMLVNQTVRDTEEKVKSIQEIKDNHKDKAPYKIGYVVSMVKKSRDVLNELFNVAVKHRDEWKALEQLKIFELIVHTNVDTTNLVRQLVEIHVQHLNSTSSTGDETTEAAGGGRRVVLI